MVKKYIPEKGDIVFLDFSPQSGKEQAGKRPAVVVSPKEYNTKARMAICCPITSKIKDYPFEVLLEKGLKTKGVVLSDHVKNLDWQARKAHFLEKLPKKTLQEVLDKLQLLLLG